jgi:transketolase
VLSALAEVEGVRVHKLAVKDMPTSGKPDELIHESGIDADAIVAAARELVRAPAGAGD